MQGKNSPLLNTIVYKATDGLIGTVANLVLYQMFLFGSLAGATTSAKIYRGFEDAENTLEEINYKTIKKALYNMAARGLVKRKHAKGPLEVTITKQGLARIQSLISRYDKKRIWDKHLYLISYDVPSHDSKKRDQLRRFLRSLGCGLLQESLWVTPYNPQLLVSNFIREHSIEGTTLVSKLGVDGAIGDEPLEKLLLRVYKLPELNSRYKEFIDHYSQKTIIAPWRIHSSYHSILKDDPQLPFALLPLNFLSEKAHKLYHKSRKALLT